MGRGVFLGSRDRSKVYKWLAAGDCLGEEATGHWGQRGPPTMRQVSTAAFITKIKDIRIPSTQCFHRNPNRRAELQELTLEG